MYSLVPSCRICSKVSEEIRQSIDKDLINGVLTQDILLKFGHHFPSETPLTEYSITNHRRHLFDYLAVNKLTYLGIEEGSVTLIPKVFEEERAVSKLLEDSALDIARGIVNEDTILKTMIIDSFKDVQYLNDMIGALPSNQRAVKLILAKDTIRQSLISTVQKNKELTQKIGGEIDRVNAIKEAMRRYTNLFVEALKVAGIPKEQGQLIGQELHRLALADTILSKYI